MPKSKKSASAKSEKLKDATKSKPAKGNKSKPTAVAPEPKKSAPESASKEVGKKAKPATTAPKLAAVVRTKDVKSTEPAPSKAPTIVVTMEEISLRAYFIAERREAMGWPGNSDTDWIEAEKQVRTEKSAS